jgi:hypothetical protein
MLARRGRRPAISSGARVSAASRRPVTLDPGWPPPCHLYLVSGRRRPSPPLPRVEPAASRRGRSMGRPWRRSRTGAGPVAAPPHHRLQELRRILTCRFSSGPLPGGRWRRRDPPHITCRCSGELLTSGRWRRRAPRLCPASSPVGAPTS